MADPKKASTSFWPAFKKGLSSARENLPKNSQELGEFAGVLLVIWGSAGTIALVLWLCSIA